jgi:hypothetical protein
MASEASSRIALSSSDKSAEVRAALLKISETYGRSICREPRRVAAMLRDLCPEQSRESFLAVAALQEQVVSDMVVSLDSTPQEILVARGTRRLRDSLGLTEDAARWAVESWLPACRILAAAPERPLSCDAPEDAVECFTGAAGDTEQAIDWGWLGLCIAATLCSGAAICTVARCAFFHFWSDFSGWLIETAVLTSGLAFAGCGLALVARAMSRRDAPNQRALDPNRAAGAMLVEVMTLLTLPLVPVSTVGLWACEWAGALHISGQPHDLSFHLGRILQSELIAIFLYNWLSLSVKVQGKIASSMVRRR